MCAVRPVYVHRLDGAEIILPLRIGEKPAVALEVLVALVLLEIVRFKYTPLLSTCQISMNALRIGLPDGLEHAAGQVRDFADGRRDVVVDDDQIVIGVERHLVGIKGPSVNCGVTASTSASNPRVVKNAAPAAMPPRNCRRLVGNTIDFIAFIASLPANEARLRPPKSINAAALRV